MNECSSNKIEPLSKHRFYGTWTGMKSRCNNANAQGYHRYGGRGITVCDEWESSASFLAWCDLTFKPVEGEHLTLDRIDNDAGYSPSNCRWATKQEQSMNSSAVLTVDERNAIKAEEKAGFINDVLLPNFTDGDRLKASELKKLIKEYCALIGWSDRKIIRDTGSIYKELTDKKTGVFYRATVHLFEFRTNIPK